MAAKDSPITLNPGTYTVGESLPDTPEGGHWEQTAAGCNEQFGRRRQADPTPVTFTLTRNRSQVCLFENRFVHAGAIRITKTTLDSIGTTGFVVTRARRPEPAVRQAARSPPPPTGQRSPAATAPARSRSGAT